MADPRLAEFEGAWHRLRAVAEQVERGEASDRELAQAVDEAVATRTHARGVLQDANRYGSLVGDQLLWVTETRVERTVERSTSSSRTGYGPEPA